MQRSHRKSIPETREGKSLYYKTIPSTYVLVVLGFMFEWITTLPFAVLVWLDRRRRAQ